MANVVGYSLIEHREDGSTEVLAKISPNTMAAAMAKIAGFGGQRQSKYIYDNADTCPVHKTPWTVKPGGSNEERGTKWAAFWKCDGKIEDEWCNHRPSKAWVETHPPEHAEPIAAPVNSPNYVPKDKASDFDDLPF